MVESFPNLNEEYVEETSWQEGDDTGSHTVYGDIFTPYLTECIEENKQMEMVQAFEYVEKILELQDEYAVDVVTFSVLESIAYLFKGKRDLCNLLGVKTKESIKEFL
ncbi:hypothetical protein NY18_05440 [Listeria monocytogenes]|nr:hypothetical protein [Listeria monocytogenes]